MNCAQICLMLATSGLVLVSANPGSYNYAYNLNDGNTGETKVCSDQVVYDDNVKPTILASKNFVSEPIIASVTSGPIMNTEFVSSTPASILRSDFDSSRIVAAAPLLETKIEAGPLIHASRLEYAPLPKFAAPITVTAAPMLETKIVAEPMMYAARPAYAPLVKYAPRPEYLAASPAPLVVSRPQTPIVHVQAPSQIIKSAQLQSYGRLSTSHSHKSFVNHPQAPLKLAAIAPQYYAAAPAAPEYYAPALAAKEYHVAAPAALEYNSVAPVAWQSAPAPIAVKIASPVVRANYGNVALHQAAGPVFAPSTYAYRSSSSPANSYQYASHWNNYEQLAAGQLRYSAASPQYYSTLYQPQLDYNTAIQVQNSGQYDGQELPCEK